ncbi:MAG: hypothetical protein H7067_06290 [Burkholderiales bacterium]|nr:hypothetical protein [Opitutaceae bacterium]
MTSFFPIRLPSLVILLVAATLAPFLHARIVFIPLEDLPGGRVFSQATAISGDGATIVGRSSSTLSGENNHEAFRWTAAEGTTGLGALSGSATSEAIAVSIDGSVVVGNSPPSGSGGVQLGFRWTSESGIVSLGDLPGGLDNSSAQGVSADGAVIVGYGSNAGNKTEAFRWTAASGPVGLGFFSENPVVGLHSHAYGISADGAVIVGTAATPLYRGAPLSGYDRAFRRTTSGLVDLGHIPTAMDPFFAPYALDYCAYAASVNGDVIVGYARLLDGESREAILWTADNTPVSLGDLPGGLRYSEARAVSADGGIVVGLAKGAGDDDGAFVWDPINGMRSVRAILTDAGLADGWSISAATGVSADGTKIVGYGRKNDIVQAWLLDLAASDNTAVHQSINFPPITDRDFDDSANTLALSATASSGLPVSFSVLSGPATVSGDNLQITGVGTVTVQATQTGDATYAPAISTRTFVVLGRTPQTIDFPEIPDHAYNPADNNVTLSATASSGLPLVFSVLSGPATVSGDMLTVLAPGIITVQIAQAGDTTYAPATATRSFTVTITKVAQTIDFAFIPDFGEIVSRFGINLKIPLVATASSGLPVYFSLVSDPGFGSVSGSIFSVWNPGYFTIQANQPGDAIHAPAIASRSFTVYYKTPQTIDFTAPPNRTFDPAGNIVTLSATSTSGLPVSYAILLGSGTINGNSLQITGAGTFILQAGQAGDATYAPATATRTLTVGKATQSITFDPLAEQGIASPSFQLAATASSGLPVSFSVSGPAALGSDGKTLTLAGTTGTVTVTARQTGDANYLAAGNVARSFAVIEGAPQMIAFDALRPRIVNSVFTLAATASSGLPVSFTVVEGPATLGADGQTVTVGASAVTVFIRATQPGGTHNGVIHAPAAPIIRSFQVTLKKLTQTISFAQPPAATYGSDPVTLTATASSTLPVSFTLPPTSTATLDGDSLDILGAGRIVVQAAQAGDDTFQPAAPVTRTITVNKKILLVSSPDFTRLVRDANPADFGLSYTGFVGSDTAAGLDRKPVGTSRATATSPAGEYPITLKGGADHDYAFAPDGLGKLIVQGFGGAYEALLVDDSGVPRGKLEIAVPANALTYTGTLNLASEPASLSIRGALSATDGASATGSFTRIANIDKNISALSLGFELSGDTLDGELSVNSAPALSIDSGSRLFVQPVVSGKKQNAPWTGLHTLVLRDPTSLVENDTRALPLGSGHASASVAATGVMTLKGKLADGTTLTGTTRADSTGHFRLYVRPYAKRLESFLSGELNPVAHPDQTRFSGRFHLDEGEPPLFWAKTESPTKPIDSAYRTGFEATLVPLLDPWLAANTRTTLVNGITLPAGTLAQRLDLAEGPLAPALIAVTYSLAEGLHFGARGDLLPVLLTLPAKGSFSVTEPVTTPANLTAFTLATTPATGAFSGSFILSDQVSPPPAKPVTRKATFSGTLRQGPTGSTSTLGHAHLLFDPVPGDSGPSANEQVSGELILSPPGFFE